MNVQELAAVLINVLIMAMARRALATFVAATENLLIHTA
jgi:hypothetical protein